MTTENEGKKPTATSWASAGARVTKAAPKPPADPCIRAENEDDDGYDPYSDRRPAPEPLFEADPWS